MGETVWQQCLQSLQEELTCQQFETWIRPLEFAQKQTNAFKLVAPNRFVKDWVEKNFCKRIEQIANNNAGGHVSVEVCLYEEKKVKDGGLSEQNAVNANSLALGRKKYPGSTPFKLELEDAEESTSTQYTHREQEICVGLNKSLIKPESIAKQFEKAKCQPRKTEESPSDEVQLDRRHNVVHVGHPDNLKQEFVFDSFVQGKSNQLAVAAARQVADNPGGAYNPLFIYGGVGLGKTHLMHAVGNMLKEQHNKKVVYLHSERFVADMVKALQLNAINDFKRFYRSVGALLIDDIQFFAKKTTSQEEFFHTFNTLLEGGHQIIMTCDRYPKEVEGLEERLKSRFGWGLTVSIEPPDLETRVAILIKKAESYGIELPQDAAFFIAQRISSNVRELEGALKRVRASAQFVQRSIDLPMVKEALKDLLAIQERLVTIDNIQRTVAEYYKIRLSDMLSKRRNRSVARPRQVAMALAKQMTSHSLPEIGESFGGRDHTTVLHACRKVAELESSNAEIEEDIKLLTRLLTN